MRAALFFSGIYIVVLVIIKWNFPIRKTPFSLLETIGFYVGNQWFLPKKPHLLLFFDEFDGIIQRF